MAARRRMFGVSSSAASTTAKVSGAPTAPSAATADSRHTGEAWRPATRHRAATAASSHCGPNSPRAQAAVSTTDESESSMACTSPPMMSESGTPGSRPRPASAHDRRRTVASASARATQKDLVVESTEAKQCSEGGAAHGRIRVGCQEISSIPVTLVAGEHRPSAPRALDVGGTCRPIAGFVRGHAAASPGRGVHRPEGFSMAGWGPSA
jgi:hypothetical protein